MPDSATPSPDARRDTDRSLAGFQKLARLLDTRFRIPGVPFRFGLDGIIGLIPGVGDAITTGMGLYALSMAHKFKLPLGARAAMIWNLSVDFLVGTIPLVGDLFDFAFHAHAKNLRIIERHLEKRAAGDVRRG